MREWVEITSDFHVEYTGSDSLHIAVSDGPGSQAHWEVLSPGEAKQLADFIYEHLEAEEEAKELCE